MATAAPPPAAQDTSAGAAKTTPYGENDDANAKVDDVVVGEKDQEMGIASPIKPDKEPKTMGVKATLGLHERHGFPYLVVGASYLAFVAGYVNIVAFLVYGRLVSHTTGTTTKKAMQTGRSEGEEVGVLALLLVSFLIGASMAGMYLKGHVTGQEFFLGSQYGVLFLCIGALLALGAIIAEFGSDKGHDNAEDAEVAGVCLWAAALGLQNGLCTSFSGCVIRTTHVTGLFTDVGLVLGQSVRYFCLDGKRPPFWKLGLLLPILVLFWFGGLCGYWLYDEFKAGRAIYLASGAMGLLGTAYLTAERCGAFETFLQEHKIDEEIERLEEEVHRVALLVVEENELRTHTGDGLHSGLHAGTQASATPKPAHLSGNKPPDGDGSNMQRRQESFESRHTGSHGDIPHAGSSDQLTGTQKMHSDVASPVPGQKVDGADFSRGASLRHSGENIIGSPVDAAAKMHGPRSRANARGRAPTATGSDPNSARSSFNRRQRGDSVAIIRNMRNSIRSTVAHIEEAATPKGLKVDGTVGSRHRLPGVDGSKFGEGQGHSGPGHSMSEDLAQRVVTATAEFAAAHGVHAEDGASDGGSAPGASPKHKQHDPNVHVHFSDKPATSSGNAPAVEGGGEILPPPQRRGT